MTVYKVIKIVAITWVLIFFQGYQEDEVQEVKEGESQEKEGVEGSQDQESAGGRGAEIRFQHEGIFVIQVGTRAFHFHSARPLGQAESWY